MMLNSKNRQPVPGPLCAAYAPLLPALDDLTDARLAEDTRAHLADCAWCRAQRATYDRLDEALRLHFAPDAMPVLSENLTASLLGDANYDGSLATLVVSDEESLDDGDQDDALEITVTPLPITLRSGRPPRRSLRLAALGASLAAMLVISLLGGLLFLSHERLTPPASPQATAKTTATTVPEGSMGLTAIAMSSATDGWAFANDGSVMAGAPDTVLHYTQGKWVKVKTDINANIEAVKMLSPTDGWAIGSAVYHFDGTDWQQMDVGDSGSLGSYQTISAVSPTNVWIAGMGHTSQPLIVHYDGHTWTQQRMPYMAGNDSMVINSIAMVSATEGWAVGTATHSVDCSNSHNNNCGDTGTNNETGIVLHYSKGVWQAALTLPNYDLSSISMVSSSEGWFGGQKQARNASFPAIGPTWNKPTLWHYGGSHWVEMSPPQTAAGAGDPVGQIKSITMFSVTDGWLFASLMDQPQPGDGATPVSPDVFHLEQGRWVAVKTPAIKNRVEVTMFQVGFVSPDEFWGIGESLVPDPSTGSIAHVVPLLVHYKSGVWNVVEG